MELELELSYNFLKLLELFFLDIAEDISNRDGGGMGNATRLSSFRGGLRSGFGSSATMVRMNAITSHNGNITHPVVS